MVSYPRCDVDTVVISTLERCGQRINPPRCLGHHTEHLTFFKSKARFSGSTRELRYSKGRQRVEGGFYTHLTEFFVVMKTMEPASLTVAALNPHNASKWLEFSVKQKGQSEYQ